MPPRRLVRAAAVVLLALPLAACSLKGEAWVDPDAVRVDVTLSYATSGPMAGMDLCNEWHSLSELTITPIESPSDQTSCRVVGEMAHQEPAWPFGRVTAATPEHLFLRIPGGYFSAESPLDDLDLTLHFPGEVLAASAGAHVQGASATWVDPDAVRTDGVTVTARARPDFPSWLVPGLAGLAWGVTLALAARWLLPRPDAPDLDAPDPDEPDAAAAVHATEHQGASSTAPPASAPDQPAEDPRVWADDA